MFPFSMFSPFSQTIGKFLYDPVTNWQGAFSPSIVFNANPTDGPIEAHILAEVGSYGKQLGVLIHAMDVLQTRLARAELDPLETKAMQAFDTLRDDATEAAKTFRAGVTADQIVDLAKTFAENRDPDERKALRDSLDSALGK
jgi:CHAD domain-containing protein